MEEGIKPSHLQTTAHTCTFCFGPWPFSFIAQMSPDGCQPVRWEEKPAMVSVPTFSLECPLHLPPPKPWVLAPLWVVGFFLNSRLGKTTLSLWEGLKKSLLVFLNLAVAFEGTLFI